MIKKTNFVIWTFQKKILFRVTLVILKIFSFSLMYKLFQIYSYNLKVVLTFGILEIFPWAILCFSF